MILTRAFTFAFGALAMLGSTAILIPAKNIRC